jgi:hypothetical protein
MNTNTEIADKYQEFFNFFNQEHNLILTIEQMDEIVSEAKKLEGKLSQHNVSEKKIQLICKIGAENCMHKSAKIKTPFMCKVMRNCENCENIVERI